MESDCSSELRKLITNVSYIIKCLKDNVKNVRSIAIQLTTRVMAS